MESGPGWNGPGWTWTSDLTYLEGARRLESTVENGGNGTHIEGSLDFVRKVGALAVACMEQHGGAPQEDRLVHLERPPGQDDGADTRQPRGAVC